MADVDSFNPDAADPKPSTASVIILAYPIVKNLVAQAVMNGPQVVQ